MKWRKELAVHGDAECAGHEKSALGEVGAMGGAQDGYVESVGAACKKNAENVAHGGTGAGAGHAVEGDSGDGDDKGEDSAACDSTVNGEYALVPASAPQMALRDAWQKDAVSVADEGLLEGAEAAVMSQMVDGLGKVVFPFYYQIRNLGVRKS